MGRALAAMVPDSGQRDAVIAAAGTAPEPSRLPAGVALGQQRLTLFVRAAIVLSSAWLCLGSAVMPVLEILVPVQRAAYAVLMPEHTVRSFGIERRSAQLVLSAASTSLSYLVVRGRAYPPGIRFDAETPARPALLYAALILAGTALTAGRSLRAAATGATVAIAGATAMAAVAPVVILAGAQWSVAFGAFEEIGLAPALVGASAFLIHGGAYALCAVAVWLAVSGRRDGNSGGA